MSFSYCLVRTVLCLCYLAMLGNAKLYTEKFNDNYVMYYEPNNETGYVHFTLEVKTTGWVRLGFNNKTADLNGADLFVGYVDGHNSVVYHDMWVPLNNASVTTPQYDPIRFRNWILENGTVIDGLTKISVKRQINTGDINYDIVFENRKMHVIWAYHENSQDITMQHSHTGSAEVNLNGGTSLAYGLNTLLIVSTLSAFKNFL